jgi:hypothetical protein
MSFNRYVYGMCGRNEEICIVSIIMKCFLRGRSSFSEAGCNTCVDCFSDRIISALPWRLLIGAYLRQARAMLACVLFPHEG